MIREFDIFSKLIAGLLLISNLYFWIFKREFNLPLIIATLILVVIYFIMKKKLSKNS
ncbi:hypothetical protein [Companilactobacillus kimchiensis]|uniref:Immunity protein n=1 Tax=Companilactobacillus kimchiensis TaxID=993692 RepID=A0A0R2LG09_9LACO|nr:hypothetical protein [Companilactobacillus kimchiensis]KRO00805.1 hypothetical protein IV57_GL000125 [Companilactobacillus kimchiensis]